MPEGGENVLLLFLYNIPSITPLCVFQILNPALNEEREETRDNEQNVKECDLRDLETFEVFPPSFFHLISRLVCLVSISMVLQALQTH